MFDGKLQLAVRWAAAVAAASSRGLAEAMTERGSVGVSVVVQARGERNALC
jgi:hypothetical protein